MTRTVLMQGKQFSLVSYGNGLAYSLLNHNASRWVYTQGDDAETFRNDLTAIETNHDDWGVDQTLSWLWDQCEYGSASTPIG